MTVLDSGQRVARKQRDCDCCKKTIAKGEPYRYMTIKFDGVVYTWGTHNNTGHCGTNVTDDDGEGTFCELCDPYR